MEENKEERIIYEIPEGLSIEETERIKIMIRMQQAGHRFGNECKFRENSSIWEAKDKKEIKSSTGAVTENWNMLHDRSFDPKLATSSFKK